MFLVDPYDYLPIFFKVTWLALGQPYGCPSASEVILKNMGKIHHYWTTTKPQQSRNWVHNSFDILYMIVIMFLFKFLLISEHT